MTVGVTQTSVALEKKTNMENFDEKNFYKKITVRFESEEDLQTFAKLVDHLNITVDTKRIAFPKKDPNEASLFD